jgi:hypothetical protein
VPSGRSKDPGRFGNQRHRGPTCPQSGPHAGTNSWSGTISGAGPFGWYSSPSLGPYHPDHRRNGKDPVNMVPGEQGPPSREGPTRHNCVKCSPASQGQGDGQRTIAFRPHELPHGKPLVIWLCCGFQPHCHLTLRGAERPQRVPLSPCTNPREFRLTSPADSTSQCPPLPSVHPVALLEPRGRGANVDESLAAQT